MIVLHYLGKYLNDFAPFAAGLMPLTNTDLDLVFHAISDPTRRAVLARLSQGELPVTSLAAPFGMALPSFAQHLKVLQASGLIATQKRGRVRWCQLVPSRYDETIHWLCAQRQDWAHRLNRLDTYLTHSQQDKPHDPSL